MNRFIRQTEEAVAANPNEGNRLINYIVDYIERARMGPPYAAAVFASVLCTAARQAGVRDVSEVIELVRQTWGDQC
jgi:hypothetical protein